MERAAHKLKTYSVFANQNRFPNEYEITTMHALYYPQLGFSIKNDIQAWYDKYQSNSPFQCDDWNQFSDPAQYTYFKYISEKIEKTYLLEGLFEMSRTTRYYGELSSDWIKKLQLLYAPQIYPAHGMQMVASYIGQMAPSSRIVIASSFQGANEISQVSRTEATAAVTHCYDGATYSSGNCTAVWFGRIAIFPAPRFSTASLRCVRVLWVHGPT